MRTSDAPDRGQRIRERERSEKQDAERVIEEQHSTLIPRHPHHPRRDVPEDDECRHESARDHRGHRDQRRKDDHPDERDDEPKPRGGPRDLVLGRRLLMEQRGELRGRVRRVEVVGVVIADRGLVQDDHRDQRAEPDERDQQSPPASGPRVIRHTQNSSARMPSHQIAGLPMSVISATGPLLGCGRRVEEHRVLHDRPRQPQRRVRMAVTLLGVVSQRRRGDLDDVVDRLDRVRHRQRSDVHDRDVERLRRAGQSRDRGIAAREEVHVLVLDRLVAREGRTEDGERYQPGDDVMQDRARAGGVPPHDRLGAPRPGDAAQPGNESREVRGDAADDDQAAGHHQRSERGELRGKGEPGDTRHHVQRGPPLGARPRLPVEQERRNRRARRRRSR